MRFEHRLVREDFLSFDQAASFNEKVAATLNAQHDILAELLAHHPRKQVDGVIEMLIAEADRHESATSMDYAARYRTELDALAVESQGYRAAYGR